MSFTINSLSGSNYYKNSASSLMFGSNNLLYNSLSDYSSIKSGAYRKLLNSYYKNTNNKATESIVTTNAQEAKKRFGALRDSAQDLYKVSSKLMSTEKSSVFGKNTSVTDEVVSEVKGFIKSYNSLIDEADTVKSKNISGKLNFMTNQVNSYKSAMEDVGITINEDKTLSLDTDKLKNADYYDVKGLFSGTNSMAYQTSVRAVNISNAALSEQYNSSLYSANGVSYQNLYNNSYNSLGYNR